MTRFHANTKCLPSLRKRKDKEKAYYENQYGDILDQLKGSMEDSWDNCDEELSLVRKVIGILDRGKQPSDNRINRM